MKRTLLLALAATSALAVAASAQESTSSRTLEKLEGFKSAGTAEPPPVAQTGRRADAIARNLTKIKLPAGFKISLFAIVPDARQMAIGPSAGVIFVGTRKTKVYVVTDRDKDRVADEVKEFVPGIAFKVPNGVCFSKDGILYIAEQNRILGFPAAEFFYENPDVAAAVVVKQGDLIPVDEESFNHTARYCRIGPDNKLYVTLGEPFNVPTKDKIDLYNKVGMAGIVRMDQTGANREIFASGVRNSVGLDFSPVDRTLWFTDNQVDGMGDDQPPGELNHAISPGQNFGFPWFGGGTVRTVEYKDETPPRGVVPPVVELPPHAADLGMTFYTARMFPAKYRGGIFTAEHGSWNRSRPVGARIMFIPVRADGTAGPAEPFAEGWLSPDNEYFGRPVDVAVMQDGSMLVSDDSVGAIYRIDYSDE
ncbi:Glucose/arabinose dehydrogenase, beta-propeller fold [Arboricoccus pini]|uniref:Glucose/arabinose dehydrogenase, beta-propeller fold n=1 Tax=Arboricoccus pini TaxID=1963835 RepID=A0A212QZ15_9PROT|nr:PQQ-dependent sugar dehydrogenase [Arboricoccus pini]SNB64871.1 Glucose/arabinose dehydrogenase, beta-propeller fold [Arboricoccus pini]